MEKSSIVSEVDTYKGIIITKVLLISGFFADRESTVPLAWLVPLRMLQLPRQDVAMEDQVDYGSINLWL